MIRIFAENAENRRFKWQHLPYAVRHYYNFLLNQVVSLDGNLIPSPIIAGGKTAFLPSYYNKSTCLALAKHPDIRETLIQTEPAPVEKPGKPALRSDKPVLGYRADQCATPDFDNLSDTQQYCRPFFQYDRMRNTEIRESDKEIDLTLSLNGLSFGSVIWLYHYERMGVFKILGVLMDDYNYRGKYPISNAVENNNLANTYSTLMEHISLLYRMGISSNLRDRITLYQRVLGVTIDAGMDVKSERNEGFMRTFNKLLDYMLEYYKAKQLAQAIQSTNPSNGIRSSVATQTSIRDTMQVLQQQFEPFEYGRNQINTFFGVATVYMTLCLLRLIKDEIGIPRQYDRPEEFVPAAYDILVAGRPVTPSESNRFIIHDNCATYGFRLLTDLELIDLNLFTTASQNSPLDRWLDDVEGWVEGYRNAYSAVPEPALAIAQ